MGTNYYLKVHKKPPCDKCGHQEDGPENIHIGKSSFGWKFGFNRRFTTAKKWREYLEHPENRDRIIDEYGRSWTLDELWGLIQDKQDGLWIYDERYKRSPNEAWRDGYEFLDDEGYRFINVDHFS